MPSSRTSPGLYRHWRGQQYRVLFVAWSESRESADVYISLATGEIFTRDEREFHELVRRTPDYLAPCLCGQSTSTCLKHPAGKIPRFTRIGDAE